MKITEQALTEVVNDASTNMSDPNYVSQLVDRLRTSQPSITQYVIAHQAELQVEGVVTTLFHVALVHRAIQIATGASPPVVDYSGLDDAASATPDPEALAKSEPSVASYIVSNVDLAGGDATNKIAARVLAHVAKAMVSA